MNRLRSVFVCCLLVSTQILSAQDIIPQDGITLNYTQIMFEVPPVKGANAYQFIIQKCNQRGEQCTESSVHHSKYRSTRMEDHFDFGQTYRWYYKGLKGKKELYQSPSYLLYISKSNLLDTTLQKMVFTKKPKKKKPGIMLVDGLKLAVDMSGKPVLYLNYQYDHAIRDINLTPQGTLTIVDNRFGEIKEMNLNGEMVWIGPGKFEESELRTDKYHHEFEKLENGHYLAAGKKKVSSFDESAGLADVPGTTLCETIVEFDAEGNEVWRFDLLPELKRQFNMVPGVDMFNPTRLGHLNGLAKKPGENVVYASFKTFNTIFKIERPSNNILYMYGAKKINFKDSVDESLAFEQQHAPIFNKKGNLLIFNNGNEKTGSGISELKIGSEVNQKNELLRSFYFKEVFDKDFYTAQMGSVQETGRNQYLICMGNLPYLFEVNTGRKKILWKAQTMQNTRWEEKGNAWKPLISYRVRQYSSLYPYYFSGQLETVKGKRKIRIANTGSEKDEFVVCESTPEGMPGKILLSTRLKPGKQACLKLSGEQQGQTFYILSHTGKRSVLLH